MFHYLTDFLRAWHYEAEGTQKLLDQLTDAALAQALYPGGRTVGRLAWHIAQTVPEMMGKTGLSIAGPGEHEAVPTHAPTIAEGYRTAAASLAEQLTARWADATLLETDTMYGETWPRGVTLDVLIKHQAHHRGQLTIGMRRAGLAVPGIYGPSKEEWSVMGMEAAE